MTDEEFDEIWTSCGWREEIDQLRAENASLTEEVTEQARLLGISAEKELTLLSKIERLGRELAATIKERNAFQDQCIRLEQKGSVSV